jgi:DNA-directed RNA polymerase specialized sigma24 family protein
MSKARHDDTDITGAIRLGKLTADQLGRFCDRLLPASQRYGGDAYDCVQDVLLRALQIGDPGLHIGQFIRAIINRRLTELRQRKRRRNISLDGSLDGCTQLPGHESLPLKNVMEKETEDAVKRELAKLKPIHKEGSSDFRVGE